MPKGEVSRPYNRTEKQAVARSKIRGKLVRSASTQPNADSTTRRMAKEAAYDNPKAKKDAEILSARRKKEITRGGASDVGKKILSQTRESTQRERLAPKGKKK
jgi:hypothetical protein